MSRCTQYIGLFFPMAPEHGDVFINKQSGKRFRYDGKYKVSTSGQSKSGHQDSDNASAKSDDDKSDIFGAWKADGVDEAVAQAAQEKDRNQNNRRHGGGGGGGAGGGQRGERNQRNNQGNQGEAKANAGKPEAENKPAESSDDSSGAAAPSSNSAE